MAAYDQYLSGSLHDYNISDEDVRANLDKLEKLV